MDILYSAGTPVHHRFRNKIKQKVKIYIECKKGAAPKYLRNVLDMIVPRDHRARRNKLGLAKQCDICSQWFPNINHFREHQRDCLQDTKGTYERGFFRGHFFGDESGNYFCFICGFRHENHKEICTHMNSHTPMELRMFNMHLIYEGRTASSAKTEDWLTCRKNPSLSFRAS